MRRTLEDGLETSQGKKAINLELIPESSPTLIKRRATSLYGQIMNTAKKSCNKVSSDTLATSPALKKPRMSRKLKTKEETEEEKPKKRNRSIKEMLEAIVMRRQDKDEDTDNNEKMMIKDDDINDMNMKGNSDNDNEYVTITHTQADKTNTNMRKTHTHNLNEDLIIKKSRSKSINDVPNNLDRSMMNNPSDCRSKFNSLMGFWENYGLKGLSTMGEGHSVKKIIHTKGSPSLGVKVTPIKTLRGVKLKNKLKTPVKLKLKLKLNLTPKQ